MCEVALLLLTASHLELAGVRVERVVVEHHATGDGDADPGDQKQRKENIKFGSESQKSEFGPLLCAGNIMKGFCIESGKKQQRLESSRRPGLSRGLPNRTSEQKGDGCHAIPQTCRQTILILRTRGGRGSNYPIIL